MNQNKKNNLNLNPFDTLREIGIILAGALKNYPYVAGLILIVVIASIVAISIGGKDAVAAFYVLAALSIIGVIFLFLIQVRYQKKRIREYRGEFSNMDEYTIKLVEKLEDTQKNNICNALKGAANDVADELNISHSLVRANLFGLENNNKLRIIKELTFNMNREEELTVSMPVGFGSAGRCFKNGKPNIAVFRKDWGRNTIDDQELRKVHPDLQWIISIPILAGFKNIHPIMVLNVDGLKERREEKELQIALSRLFCWSQIISIITEEIK